MENETLEQKITRFYNQKGRNNIILATVGILYLLLLFGAYRHTDFLHPLQSMIFFDSARYLLYYFLGLLLQAFFFAVSYIRTGFNLGELTDYIVAGIQAYGAAVIPVYIIIILGLIIDLMIGTHLATNFLSFFVSQIAIFYIRFRNNNREEATELLREGRETLSNAYSASVPTPTVKQPTPAAPKSPTTESAAQPSVTVIDDSQYDKRPPPMNEDD